jgi:hypothetical protein
MKCGLHFILTLDAYEFGRSPPESGLSLQLKNQREWGRGWEEATDNLGSFTETRVLGEVRARSSATPQQQVSGQCTDPVAHFVSWDDGVSIRLMEAQAEAEAAVREFTNDQKPQWEKVYKL